MYTLGTGKSMLVVDTIAIIVIEAVKGGKAGLGDL